MVRKDVLVSVSDGTIIRRLRSLLRQRRVDALLVLHTLARKFEAVHRNTVRSKQLSPRVLLARFRASSLDPRLPFCVVGLCPRSGGSSKPAVSVIIAATAMSLGYLEPDVTLYCLRIGWKPSV
jgi:hypothetical protein